jgi:hypothetical protein
LASPCCRDTTPITMTAETSPIRTSISRLFLLQELRAPASQQCLNFFPLPHGQTSFRPGRFWRATWHPWIGLIGAAAEATPLAALRRRNWPPRTQPTPLVCVEANSALEVCQLSGSPQTRDRSHRRVAAGRYVPSRW